MEDHSAILKLLSLPKLQFEDGDMIFRLSSDPHDTLIYIATRSFICLSSLPSFHFGPRMIYLVRFARRISVEHQRVRLKTSVSSVYTMILLSLLSLVQ